MIITRQSLERESLSFRRIVWNCYVSIFPILEFILCRKYSVPILPVHSPPLEEALFIFGRMWMLISKEVEETKIFCRSTDVVFTKLDFNIPKRGVSSRPHLIIRPCHSTSVKFYFHSVLFLLPHHCTTYCSETLLWNYIFWSLYPAKSHCLKNLKAQHQQHEKHLYLRKSETLALQFKLREKNGWGKGSWKLRLHR